MFTDFPASGSIKPLDVFPLYRICFAVTRIFADISRTGIVRKGTRRIFDSPSPRRPLRCFLHQRLMALDEENNNRKSSFPI